MSPAWMLFLRLAAALAAFRVIGLPLARLALPGLPAAAWAVATTAGLVVSAHTTWLLCHLGLRLGALSIGLGAAVAAALAWAARAACRRRGLALGPPAAPAAAHAAAFLLAFAFALLVVARNPAVDPDSERFMDLAMYNAVLASRTLPLEDPWLAGERVAYYDYGYFAAAHLAILTGDPDRFFNVAVALLYAAPLAGLLALGFDLARWRGGLLCAFFVSIAGNLDGLAQLVSRGWVAGFDWFHGARVLAGGITEFPLFTLLWGDLHPYALALPLWPLLLAVAATLARGEAGAATLALAAPVYAALLATNTWDAVPVAALLVLAALAGRRPGALPGAALVVLPGSALALPYLVHLPTAGRGLSRVVKPSTMPELLDAWGAVGAILAAAGIVALLGRPRGEGDPGSATGRPDRLALAAFAAGLLLAARPAPGGTLAALAAAAALGLALAGPDEDRFAWALAATGAGLVAGVEWLYVDDWYVGELERMNTVFKAYVEAWVLLGTAAALHAARLLERGRQAGGGWRWVARGLVATAAMAAAVYPLRAVPARTGGLLPPLGLDVKRTLRDGRPDDAAAIEALRTRPRGVFLEATGGPYSWHGRFSTFTGWPAVVGWGHHEMGWRNETAPVQLRVDAVREAYATDSLPRALELARAHRVRWLVVGSLERAEHPAAALDKFASLPVAVRAGETVVYDLEAAR